MKRIVSIGLFAAALIFAARGAQAQGCDTLLRDGVFETMNQFGSTYSTDQWHNAWCNGTVTKTVQGGNESVGLNLGIGKISLGFSFDEAKSFQQFYQSNYCGTADRSTVDMSQLAIVRKRVSAELVGAYVECHKTETSGLRTDFDVVSDKRVFIVTMRYIGDSQGHKEARLDTVSFKPESSKPPKCDGTLKPKTKIGLNSLSMSCERFADGPITVFIGTSVGSFHRQVPAIVQPPSDTERVMKAMPSGTILAWTSKAPVPAGWHVCDGTAGTPNLNERFLIGTNDPAFVGKATGEPTHTHQITVTTGAAALTNHDNAGNEALFKAGGENHNGYYHHGHFFSITPPTASNFPPSTYVLYIMKL